MSLAPKRSGNDLQQIRFLPVLGNGAQRRKIFYSCARPAPPPLTAAPGKSIPTKKTLFLPQGRRRAPRERHPRRPTRQNAMADPRSEEAIEKLRAEIDAIDDEMLTLVRRRFNLSRRIMTDEHRYGMPVEVFSHEREQQTIDRLKKLNEDSDCPMRSAHIGNIWQMIFSCTRVGW